MAASCTNVPAFALPPMVAVVSVTNTSSPGAENELRFEPKLPNIVVPFAVPITVPVVPLPRYTRPAPVRPPGAAFGGRQKIIAVAALEHGGRKAAEAFVRVQSEYAANHRRPGHGVELNTRPASIAFVSSSGENASTLPELTASVNDS